MVIDLVKEARAELVQRRRESRCGYWFRVLDEVKDPELPVLSIWDLGVLQDVQEEGGVVEVTITPTYSGCPAMETIRDQIVEVLRVAGAKEIAIHTQLTPAWTSDWIDGAAQKRLRDFGIAPPGTPACPQCGSTRTRVISDFGSTACKALYRCLDCREPFDYFKPF